MENIKRKIRLFFITYGRLLFYIIGAIALVILVIQGLNSIVVEQNSKKMSNVNSEEIIKIQNQKQEMKVDKEYISKFIDYCNEGKIEEAYEMIEEECRMQKYPSIEKFKELYINKVFYIKQEYSIKKIDSQIYQVTYMEDSLQLGTVKDRRQIEENYQIIEDVLGNKKLILI